MYTVVIKVFEAYVLSHHQFIDSFDLVGIRCERGDPVRPLSICPILRRTRDVVQRLTRSVRLEERVADF